MKGHRNGRNILGMNCIYKWAVMLYVFTALHSAVQWICVLCRAAWIAKQGFLFWPRVAYSAFAPSIFHQIVQYVQVIYRLQQTVKLPSNYKVVLVKRNGDARLSSYTIIYVWYS